jgi:hypothetical protein
MTKVGKRKFTQRDFVVIDVSPTSSDFASETGAYAIHSDCTGTAIINYRTGHGSISSS